MSDVLHMYVGVKKAGLLFGSNDVKFRQGDFRTSGRFGYESDLALCTKDTKFKREGSMASLKNCSSGEKLQPFSIYLNIPAVPMGQHYINSLTLK